MKVKNFWIKVFKIIFIDIVWEIFYFPFWWYSVGFYRIVVFFIKKIKKEWYNLGIGIHFKFLFKPMYAQRDFSGRVISFFARIIQLIFKLIVFLIIFFIFLIFIVLWIILPAFIVWQIYINYPVYPYS